MTDVSSVSSSTASSILDLASDDRSLNTEDFLQLLVTQLTNQDPFEPMSNQELLNQISSIQQLESTKTMNSTMTSMSSQFDTLINQLGGLVDTQQSSVDSLSSFVNRQQLSSATELIGQIVSGNTDDGDFTYGKVLAVSVTDDGIMLELDSGQKINVENMTRLTTSSKSGDLVGMLMAGLVDDQNVVGTVQSVGVDDDQVYVTLKTKLPNESGTVEEAQVRVPLSDAAVLNQDTVDQLMNRYVEGFSGVEPGMAGKPYVSGYVKGYEITADGISLVLDTGETLPIDGLVTIDTPSTTS